MPLNIFVRFFRKVISGIIMSYFIFLRQKMEKVKFVLLRLTLSCKPCIKYQIRHFGSTEIKLLCSDYKMLYYYFALLTSTGHRVSKS